MIDPHMQRYFQRIYGAQASPEILRSRPGRKPPRRRTVFVNRLTEDSTVSPSVIFEDTFRREVTGGSLPDSNRGSSALSRKIDDFLNSAVIQEKNEALRGSTRSLSSSTRSRRYTRRRSNNNNLDYPLPDLSRVKSTLLGSKHYQGPRGRSEKRNSSNERTRINHHHSTDNESSQDSAYAGESSRQHTPVGRRTRRRPSVGRGEPCRVELSTYLKYLNEVTTDILAQGAYSPKSLNKILESRLVKYQKETSRREALEMMAKLKKDLGISSSSVGEVPPSSSAGSARRRRRPEEKPLSQPLYRSRSCDDVLDIYSDVELFNLLKKDAGLDRKLAGDVIRVVRGRSEENLSVMRKRLPKERTPLDEDEYNDEEFEKSSGEEEEEEEKEERGRKEETDDDSSEEE